MFFKKIYTQCFRLLIVIFMVFCVEVSAATQAGKIVGYVPYDANGKEMIFFQLQGNVSGGCNTTARFVIDSSSLKFRGTVAAIIAAYHAQADVTVIHQQSCSSWSNSWDAQAICVGNINPC